MNVGEQAPGNGGPKKGKGKGNHVQSPAPSDASTSMVNQDTRYREPEPRGRPSEAPPARSRNDVPMPPVTNDAEVTSIHVLPQWIVSSDSHARNVTNRYEDPDGIQESHLEL